MFIYCICTQYLVGAPFALIELNYWNKLLKLFHDILIYWDAPVYPCYLWFCGPGSQMSEKHKHKQPVYMLSPCVWCVCVCVCVYRRNSESQCWSENLDTACAVQPNIHYMSGLVARSQQQHHMSLSLLTQISSLLSSLSSSSFILSPFTSPLLFVSLIKVIIY